MPVLLLLAGAVIVAGVVAVAMGHGGEMAEFPSDYVPPTLGDLLTAADVAMVRPPAALWGYNTQVTDEALTRIAQIVTERDVEIAVLRQQLADLRSDTRAVRPAGRAPLASTIRAEPEPPVTAEPEAAEPEPSMTAEPEVPEAEVAEPKVAEPVTAEPEAPEPEAVEAEVPEAEAAEVGAGAPAQDGPPPAPAVASDEAAAPADG